jgi:hypothetical protein
MSDVVLVGPFWTRAETASYLGLTGSQLLQRRDLVRLEGRWLEETYPAFQFSDRTVRHQVAAIVEETGDDLPGTAIADWLCRSNPLLGAMSPIAWFAAGLSVKTAITAIHADLEEVRRRVAPTVAAAS